MTRVRLQTLLLGLLMAACGSKELTRDKAQTLILQTVPAKKEWRISQDVFQGGLKAGLWTSACVSPPAPSSPQKPSWTALEPGNAKEGCEFHTDGTMSCNAKTFTPKYVMPDGSGVEEPVTHAFISPKSPSGRWLFVHSCRGATSNLDCAGNFALIDLTTGASRIIDLSRMHGADQQHWVLWAPEENYAVIAQYEYDEGEAFPVFYRVNLKVQNMLEIKETPKPSELIPYQLFLETAQLDKSDGELFTVLARRWNNDAAGHPFPTVLFSVNPKLLTLQPICTERQITELGRKYIDHVESNPESAAAPKGGFDWNQFGATMSGKPNDSWGKVSLVNPINVGVEVTGITAAPGQDNTKIVEFTWGLKDVPEPLLKVMTPLLQDVSVFQAAGGVKPGKGTAVMQLYDDGWRVKEISGIRYHVAPDDSFALG